MKPRYYDTNNIVRIQKRPRYYEIYIKDLKKPFYIDHDDKWIVKTYKLKYNGNYIIANGKSIHRLIKSGPIIHHINHNKLDNRKENLEVLNDNQEHASKHFKKTGELSYKYTLDQDDIDILAELNEDEPISLLNLSELKHLS